MKIDKNYKDYLYFLIGESLIKNFSDEILINNFCSLHEIYNFRNNVDLLTERRETILEVLPAIAAGGTRVAATLGKAGTQAAKAGSNIVNKAANGSSKIANSAKNAVNTAIKVGKNSIENMKNMSQTAISNMKDVFKKVSNVIRQKGKAQLTSLLNNKIPEMLKNSKPFIDDAIKQITDENTKSFLNRFKTLNSKDALNNLISESELQNLVITKELFKEKIYEICSTLGIEFNRSNDIDKKENQEKLLGIISEGVVDTENIDPVILQRLIACISFVSFLNDIINNSNKNNINKDQSLEKSEDEAAEDVKGDSFLSRVFMKADAKQS